MKEIGISGFTKQRQAVLSVIRNSDEHLTANEVFEGARRILPGISFATVYNSLRYLKNEGLIGEVNFGVDAARYDRKLDRHDHAVCSKCGKIIDVDLPIPEGLLKNGGVLSKFKVESVEIIVHGLCPDCS
jgi:Fur family transcriptional regulator, peroxide stress response regulator